MAYPFGRLGHSEDGAGAGAVLMSPVANPMTGHVLAEGGGLLMA